MVIQRVHLHSGNEIAIFLFQIPIGTTRICIDASCNNQGIIQDIMLQSYADSFIEVIADKKSIIYIETYGQESGTLLVTSTSYTKNVTHSFTKLITTILNT